MPRSGKSKRAKQITGPDEHYGLLATDNPLNDKMSAEEFTLKKSALLSSLQKTVLERAELERQTILQANSPLWKAERKNRLTASWFGKVCHMRSTTSCRGTVHSMLYGTFSNKAMVHGQVNEPIAKGKMASQHGIVASNCGLFVDSAFPFLAASPDGLVDHDGLMEVKCPLSGEEFATLQDALSAGKIPSCHLEGGLLQLKPTDNWYYQVQGQLHIAQKEYCIFVLYTKNWMAFQRIERDDTFWKEKMVDYLQRFYIECLLPELINPQFGKRLQKSDIVDPPYIKRAQIAALNEKEKVKQNTKKPNTKGRVKLLEVN